MSSFQPEMKSSKILAQYLYSFSHYEPENKNHSLEWLNYPPPPHQATIL